MESKELIVDDEQNILNSLERILRKVGHEVLIAGDGLKAIDLLEANDDIAVLICDQKMPEVSGAEVLNRAGKLSPDTVQIALSGHSDKEMFLEAINKGNPTRFITKPWDDDALKIIIDEAVEKYTAIRENKLLQSKIMEQNRKLKKLSASLEEKVKNQVKDIILEKKNLWITLQNVVDTLADIMERHTVGIRGKGKRIARLTHGISNALKLPKAESTDIRIASLLHEIGLVSIPQDLLGKSEMEMTGKEKELFRRHSVVGYDILKGISGFDRVAKIVRHHHETVDGKGYPDKLRRNDIPLGSKIIAIADIFDCRMYPPDKPVIASKESAAEALTELSGISLDARLVDLFIKSVLPVFNENDSPEIEISLNSLRDGMVLSKDVLNISGIPLLKANIKLTGSIIEKLKRNEEFDPVISRIFVRRESVRQASMIAAASTPRKKKEGKRSSVVLGNPVKAETAKPLILVVDDLSAVVNALRRELKSAGYDVADFTATGEALNFLHNNSSPEIFAVITDFFMPGMRGDRFMVEVQRELPDVPFIVITGETTPDTIKSVMQSAKVASIIKKPWNRDQLLEILDALKRQRAEESASKA